MSAPRKWPNPAQQLRTGLAYARQRGVPFDEAWDELWRGLYWGSPDARPDWRTALIFARPEFQAAYERRDTHASRSLRTVGERPDADTTAIAAIPPVAQRVAA